MFRSLVIAIGFGCCIGPAWAIDTLSTLANSSRNTEQAAELLRQLSTRTDLTLGQVLAAIKSVDAIGKNYLLSLAQTLADRQPQQAAEYCQQFLTQLDQDSMARYWAFVYLTSYQPDLREKLLENMLEDPAPELRYEAIELHLRRLTEDKQLDEVALQSAYTRLLNAARLPAQVDAIAKKVETAGGKVDLLEHYGFLSNWQVVGVFDNSNQGGFDVVYDPEKEYLSNRLLDLASPDGGLSSRTYTGKQPDLTWKAVTTDSPEGKIDLNLAYDKAKGAVVYGLGRFSVNQPMQAELRVGSTNAIKVWVNGQLILQREAYHAGAQIDQYVGAVELQPGVNLVLVKVCQNEQTEDWAQDWFFMARFTDSAGLALRPSVVAP